VEKVTGIGGVFFRAKDPSALQGWYAEHLGVEPPQTYEGPVWRQEAGPTVFAAFAALADPEGNPIQLWEYSSVLP
jgi:glyoxylase I family protein